MTESCMIEQYVRLKILICTNTNTKNWMTKNRMILICYSQSLFYIFNHVKKLRYNEISTICKNPASNFGNGIKRFYY